MKTSIFIALFIFLAVVGWIGSGQIANVKAQDESSESIEQTQSKEEIILNNQNTDNDELNNQETVIIMYPVNNQMKIQSELYQSSLLLFWSYLYHQTERTRYNMKKMVLWL